MNEPLYAQIARELASGIAAGKFAVGSLLPAESELCRQFGASRHTVREALRELAELRLVERRNGVGTRVLERSTEPSSAISMGSLSDQEGTLASHPRIFKKSQAVVADLALARTLGIKAGTRWLNISCLRAATKPTEPPACWTDHYVPTTYTGLKALVIAHPEVMIRDLIAQHYGRRYTEIHEEIVPMALDAAMAERLQAPVGSPALRVTMRYADRSGKILHVDTGIHPEGRVKFVTVIKA